MKNWSPIVGDEALKVLKRLPEKSRPIVESEALSVLSRCVPPTEFSDTATGIVVGYVQSGKTASFSTLAGLAADNGYQLVIVVTGTSIALFNQSTDRLAESLSLSGRESKWKYYKSSELRQVDKRSLQSAFERWTRPRVSDSDKKSVLIATMKQGRRLDRLISLLASLDLRRVPAIVIDDEADQASLNNKVREAEASAIYSKIVDIRSLLPSHSFIQYTATPQAPLLINLIDVLAPDFGIVLTPGDDYVGGKAYFESPMQFVRPIPADEIPTKDQPLLHPPGSLLKALQFFLIGVASSFCSVTGSSPRRAMLVHPGKPKIQHADFKNWIDHIVDRWGKTLARDEDDRDRLDLLAEFLSVYEDLRKTVINIPGFDEISLHLQRAAGEVFPCEVNTREVRTAVLPNREDYPILVGAQAMERGVTLDGLIATYMPRGIGVGNADTLQQRARWFGYRAEYLGYCRVFLAPETFEAMRSYVSHEENLRAQLKTYQDEGKELGEWKRAFILDPRLRPTRDSVLSLDYSKGEFSSKWVETKYPHYLPEAIVANKSLVEEFCERLNFAPDEGDNRRLDSHRHQVAIVRLDRLLDEFLLRYRHAYGADSRNFTGLALQIRKHLDSKPDDICSVYRMSPLEVRQRGTADSGHILKLLQGPYPPLGNDKIYPGDRKVLLDSRKLAMQIHELDIYQERVKGKKLLEERVCALAVWVPAEMAAGWYVQERKI